VGLWPRGDRSEHARSKRKKAKSPEKEDHGRESRSPLKTETGKLAKTRGVKEVNRARIRRGSKKKSERRFPKESACKDRRKTMYQEGTQNDSRENEGPEYAPFARECKARKAIFKNRNGSLRSSVGTRTSIRGSRHPTNPENRSYDAGGKKALDVRARKITCTKKKSPPSNLLR